MIPTIEVENIGAVSHLSFHLREYGVTVLTGRNGAGKSTVLNAVQKLASNDKRPLPLRDGEKRGRIEGFGARLTISNSARHTGEFEIEHLEGKFDLAELVDPRMADPLAADRRRIRALVTLTGATPDVKLFRENPAFGGAAIFDKITDGQATAKHDLVDMGEAIKKCYEREARKQEDEAEQEIGKAKALESQAGEFDPAAETDGEKLQERYDKARDARARLTLQQSDAAKNEASRKQAQESLDRAKADYKGPTAAEAKRMDEERMEFYRQCCRQTQEMRKMLEEAEANEQGAFHQVQLAQAGLKAAVDHETLVTQCQQTIDAAVTAAPSDKALADAEQAFQGAKRAMEYGTLARAAKTKLDEALAHRQASKEAADRAATLRGAAGSIDEVLSSAIKSKTLRVESLDGKARLVVDHAGRGKAVPYHELSDGERWRVAIDLAADITDLVVIPQHAWEGIDVYVRQQIHEHAKERKVYVLTAEATRDPADGEELRAQTFEPVEA